MWGSALFFGLLAVVGMVLIFGVVSERRYNRRRLQQYTDRVRKREAELRAMQKQGESARGDGGGSMSDAARNRR